MRLMFISMIFFTGGCASGMEDGPLLIGVDLADTDTTILAVRASEEWNSCSSRQVYVVAKGSKHSYPLNIVQSIVMPNGVETTGVTHTHVDPDGTVHLINIEIKKVPRNPERNRVSIEHEMGHALGVPHIGDAGTLMSVKETPADAHVTSDLCKVLKDLQ